MPYRGRIAPTPSGWLHLGHAATFYSAWQRARASDGNLVYRTEDIDKLRCKKEYAVGAMEDLRWWGLDWDEGPDLGGNWGPYEQSSRIKCYKEAREALVNNGRVYASPHSRSEIRMKTPVRSPIDEDQIFPAEFRMDPLEPGASIAEDCNIRFQVPDGRIIEFEDGRSGVHRFEAGKDFGDFVIWKKDGSPSYDLAVVVDDHKMEITEVVRGEDLLVATARQILLYEALGWEPPAWYHCALVEDPETGYRMSKTRQSLSLRYLREKGLPPGKPAAFYF